MIEYPKINSIFKRDERGTFLEDQWSHEAFEYLQYDSWYGTEKIDGTNIRVMWDAQEKTVKFAGRTDKSQMYLPLLKRLEELFPESKFSEQFPEQSVCLYGEGYGAKIQGGGGNYIKDGVDFILFDIKIENYWLRLGDVFEVADQLDIKSVPSVFQGNLRDAIDFVKEGFNSLFGAFPAEGLVLRPSVTLYDHGGERIITKIKTKDWRK